MKSGVRKCRKCGRPVAEITWGAFRKSIVDADAVWVVADAHGEDYVRIDGSKVKAVKAEVGTIQAEPAYRLHRKTCGVGS